MSYGTITFEPEETEAQRLDLALAYLREHTEHEAVVFSLEVGSAILIRDGRMQIMGHDGTIIRRYEGIQISAADHPDQETP